MSESPAEGWRILRHVGAGDGVVEVPSRPSGVETGYGPARYALGPAGQLRLLVPCGSMASARDLGASQNLHVSRALYVANGRNVPFLDIMCKATELEPVFSELVEEILTRLAEGSTPDEAVTGTIADFRNLLTRNSQNVEVALLIGLIGELQVLLRLAETARGKALNAWTGPSGARHDFRSSAGAIEVKSSARFNASTVTINGLEQLLEPATGRLHLAHVRMEEGSGGAGLGDLVGRATSLGVDRDQLISRLAEAGCDDPAGENWNLRKFHLHDIRFYRVETGFPRLLPDAIHADCRSAILRVDYDLDLEAASAFRIANDDARHLLQGFCP